MKSRYVMLFGGVTSLTAASLYWRFAARFRSMPCPSWLPWLLENPYMNALAGSDTLLERAELALGMKLLDVGCGVGRLTLPAARRVGADGEVVALDIQPAMLQQVRQKMLRANLTNIRLVQAGAGDGTLEADLFDRALLVTVLGEIPNREAALAEIFKALKPGGILSITEVLPDPHYQTRATVRRLAAQAGFEVQAAFGFPLAFTLNFAKPQRDHR